MDRMQRLLYAFIPVLLWSGGQLRVASAQRRPLCSSALSKSAFDGRADIKILVTGFGYPDERADLFGTRYAGMLQTFIGLPNGNARPSSASSVPTIHGRTVRYLPCAITSHSAARQLGKEVGADLVVWGQVQWRSWQAPPVPQSDAPGKAGPETVSSPIPQEAAPSQEAPGTQAESAKAGASPKQVNNTFSGSVGQVQQTYVYAQGATAAMIMPYLTAVRWVGLDVEAEQSIQISDHRDLKNEALTTLFGRTQLALIFMLLGHYAADQRSDTIASQHIKALEQYADGQHIQIISGAHDSVLLMTELGKSLIRNKDYNLGIPFLQRAIDRCDQADIHCSADGYERLGWAYQQKGSSDDAIAYYLKALAFWNRTQRNDKTADTHSALAELYRERLEYDETIHHAKQQANIDEQLGEKYQARLARGLFMLGEAYNMTEQHKQSIVPLCNAIKIYEKLGIERQADLAETHHQLGIAYQHQKDLLMALEQFRAELITWKSLDRRRRIAETLDLVAAVFRSLRNEGEAIIRYHEAALYYQSAVPPDYEEARSSLKSALILCRSKPCPQQHRESLQRQLDAISIKLNDSSFRIVD